MANSSILNLLLLEQAQAQAHIPVNEAIKALERAGCGYLALDASSGDIALTDSQAQYHFLKLFGTPSADFEVTVGNDNRIMLIGNNTSKLATIKRTTSGATITVEPEEHAVAIIAGDDVFKYSSFVGIKARDVSHLGDWNSVVEAGFVRGTGMSNKPDGSGFWQYGIVLAHSDNFVFQILSDYGSSQSGPDRVWFRKKDNGSWTSWKKLIDSGGSVELNRTAVSADYTVASDDYLVAVTDTSAARTITLPTSGMVARRQLVIKDESGGAGTNNITVTTEGSETIDGAATATISTNYGVIRLYTDGNDWFTR